MAIVYFFYAFVSNSLTLTLNEHKKRRRTGPSRPVLLPVTVLQELLLLPHELVDLVNHLVVGTLHLVEDAYADDAAD